MHLPDRRTDGVVEHGKMPGFRQRSLPETHYGRAGSGHRLNKEINWGPFVVLAPATEKCEAVLLEPVPGELTVAATRLAVVVVVAVQNSGMKPVQRGQPELWMKVGRSVSANEGDRSFH
jgi:hypothetical protein